MTVNFVVGGIEGKVVFSSAGTAGLVTCHKFVDVFALDGHQEQSTQETLMQTPHSAVAAIPARAVMPALHLPHTQAHPGKVY